MELLFLRSLDLIFNYEKIWFTDSNSLTADSFTAGIIIDTTPFIVDLENDFSNGKKIIMPTCYYQVLGIFW